MLSAAPDVVQFVLDCDRDMSPCRIHQWSVISLHSGCIRKLKVLTELDRILLIQNQTPSLNKDLLEAKCHFYQEGKMRGHFS